jgi:hypothetical protein
VDGPVTVSGKLEVARHRAPGGRRHGGTLAIAEGAVLLGTMRIAGETHRYVERREAEVTESVGSLGPSRRCRDSAGSRPPADGSGSAATVRLARGIPGTRERPGFPCGRRPGKERRLRACGGRASPPPPPRRREGPRSTACLRLIRRTLPGAPIDRPAALPLISATRPSQGIPVEAAQPVSRSGHGAAGAGRRRLPGPGDHVPAPARAAGLRRGQLGRRRDGAPVPTLPRSSS